jgi:transposase
LLVPNVRKTWAPAGCTPILRHSYSRDKISTIGGLTVSPVSQRLGLYVRFHSHNITGTEVLAFVRRLLRHLRGPVVMLWDGGPIHKRADVKALLQKVKRLHVYRFPAYAPELNPIELVWTHGKRDLSNSAHTDTVHLCSHLRRSIGRVRSSQQLLMSCIDHSDLPW